MSIRSKLILVLGLPILAISLAAVAFDYNRLRNAAFEQTRSEHAQIAERYAAEYNGLFRELAQIARSTAAFLEANPKRDEQELYDLLERDVRASRLIYGACIAFAPRAFDEDRRLVAPYVYRGPDAPLVTDPGPAADDAELLRMDVADAYDYTGADWDWFNTPQETGRPTWTEPFFDHGAGDVAMVTYVTPFFMDGRFRGTVSIDIRLDDLQASTGAIDFRRSHIAILSRQGTYIAWPFPDEVMRDTIFDTAERLQRRDVEELGREMLAGRRGTHVLTGVNDENHLVFYAPIESTGWSFGVLVPESEIMGPVYAQLRLRTGLAMISVGLLLVVVLAAGVYLTRPIERLAAGVRRLGTGTLDAQVEGVRSRDELGELANAFNTMVQQLRNHVERLTRETAARQAVESELRVAHAIQSSMLPNTFPSEGNLRVHAISTPARMVGGDFFDVYTLPDGRAVLVVADVSGKGVPAAIFMAVTRTLLRGLATGQNGGSSPAEILRRANELILPENSQGLFVTVFMAIYDPADGRVSYANAGHPLPYLLDADGNLRQFGETTGTVVGVLEGPGCEDREERLAPGDRLVLFTDGLLEARDSAGEFFGEARLEDLLRNAQASTPQALCQHIAEHIDAYQGEDRYDDLTLLVLERPAYAETDSEPLTVASISRLD